MTKRAFLLLGMLFFFVGCQVSYPSPFGTGSMYEAEINSKSARVEIIFPWAPLLLEDTKDVQEE